MLARLQQLLILGALLLVVGWAAACWHSGHPAWIWVGAALLVGGYAGVLGLEFMLLRLSHHDGLYRRPALSQLLRAWWGEVWMAPRVFCWRQPFRSQHWPDQVPAAAQGRRGLLLVHGFVCNRGLWNPWLQRLSAQGVPFVAVNLEPVFGSIDDYVAIIDAGVQRLHRGTGLAPVIVAHSMGGLAARAWWATQADAAPVHRLITIGTPHRGTWLAGLAFAPNVRQMRRGSGWLKALVEREPDGRAARCTCFYSPCDNIVFPPSMATLDGADNRLIAGVAHVHMVDSPEPWATAQRWLGADKTPRPPA